MDRYAVIGQPVGHSLSPRIHAAFAAQTGQELTYEALETAPEALAESLGRMHAEGWRGCNVTLPHKMAALAASASSTERAQRAGAANTLLRTDAGWSADNTDGAGLVADLAAQGIAIGGKRVVVLGAGGAARGILEGLLTLEPAELVVSNRNPWKPEELAVQFKPLGAIRPCTHLALKGDRFDVVINATSAGHAGQAVKLPFQVLAEGGACYDLSYGQAHGPFRQWAQVQGAARVADGLGMLVEQAAEAFHLWRGVRPATAPVLAVLRA